MIEGGGAAILLPTPGSGGGGGRQGQAPPASYLPGIEHGPRESPGLLGKENGAQGQQGGDSEHQAAR